MKIKHFQLLKRFFTFRYFSKLHLDLLLRIPNSFLILGALFAILQSLGLLLISEVEVQDNSQENLNSTSVNTNETDDIAALAKDESKYQQTNSLGVKYNIPSEGLSVKESIKTPSFILLSIMLNFYPIGPDLFATNYKVSFF